LGGNSTIFAQTTDTIIQDSIVQDTVVTSAPLSKSAIDTRIDYKAQDSIFFDLTSDSVFFNAESESSIAVNCSRI
jgi:hypothetical protein